MSSIKFDEFIGEVLRNSNNPKHREVAAQIDPAQKAGKHDPLFQKALRIAIQNPGCNSIMLSKKLSIGYGRSAAMMDAIRNEGIKY